jgi:CheY-like chemotaxis protein
MKETILVVDDDISIQQCVPMLLEYWKYKPISVMSEREVHPALKEHPEIKVIFMDGNLKGGFPKKLDTVDLVKSIKVTWPDIKIVAFSSNDDWNAELVRAGCDTFLSKPPSDMHLIQRVVEECLSKDISRERVAA